MAQSERSGLKKSGPEWLACGKLCTVPVLEPTVVEGVSLEVYP